MQVFGNVPGSGLGSWERSAAPCGTRLEKLPAVLQRGCSVPLFPPGSSAAPGSPCPSSPTPAVEGLAE